MRWEKKIFETKNETRTYYWFNEEDREYYKAKLKEKHYKARDMAKFFGWCESYFSKVLSGKKPILESNLRKIDFMLDIKGYTRY